MIQRAYRFRLYPTASQRKQLAVEFGCAWFVWNKALALRTDAYEQRKEHHNYVSLNRLVTEWKRTAFPWLAEATAGNLTQALIDQDKAFDHFFRRAKAGQKPGYPRFKSRYHRQSVRYPLDQRRMATTYQAGVFLKLPKLGAVKIRWSRVPTGTPKMATVSKDPCGRSFMSFACEEAIAALPLTGHAVGLALGIKHVVVASDGY